MNNYQPGQQYGQSSPSTSGGPLNGLSQKTLIIGAAVGIVVMFIIGSLIGVASSKMKSDTEPPVNVDTSEPTDDATSDEYGDQDKRFIEAIRKNLPAMSDTSDEELIAISNDICAQMDAGEGFEKVATALISDYGGDTAGYLATSSVIVKCPKYEDEVYAYLGEEPPSSSKDGGLTEDNIATIRTEVPQLEGVSDEDLIRLSSTICERLDNSEGIEDTAFAIADKESYTPEEMLFLMFPATQYVCSQHVQAVNDYLDYLEAGGDTRLGK